MLYELFEEPTLRVLTRGMEPAFKLLPGWRETDEDNTVEEIPED